MVLVAAIAHGRLWHFSAVPTAQSNVRLSGVDPPTYAQCEFFAV